MQRHIAALEKKGLIKRHARSSPAQGRMSNFLDPSGLVFRLQEVQRTFPPPTRQGQPAYEEA